MRSLALVLLVGCVSPEPASAPVDNPNAGLLRDFLDGKFDSAGHPLNARVTEAEALCPASGAVTSGALRLNKACVGTPLGFEQNGDLVASIHLNIAAHAASGRVVTADLSDEHGDLLGTATLDVAQLRAGWMDLPVKWHSVGTSVTLKLTPATGATIDVDYVDVFPEQFGLVASPGSGVYMTGDMLVFEMPIGHKLDKIKLDGKDITPVLTNLIASGKATRMNTEYRSLVTVAVNDLAAARRDLSELELRSSALAARMQLRKADVACNYEGSGGVKVLVTGFQPFPADATHDNVSGVAVTSLDVSQIHNAQVMRVVLPVEYDRAAAEVTDIIARCDPRVVISFGQGGDHIALEEVAYNLQDTGEVSGGVPDNRGIVRAAVQIDPSADATRDTMLPLDAINDAIVALGEAPQHSRDPGRYICNNVMFGDIGAMQSRGIGGFIHLPYTVTFDAATKQRFAKVVQAAIQATVDTL